MNLEGLTTEARNEATKKIDQVSTLEMVTLINQEDQKVAQAIEKVLPQIAAAIDAAA
ncbi:MAG: N-acetylmuramic acid 6-phosphate etherase, partial [Enterococcus faecalis]|nr:N-acetylmuramic acid 6-phosphate etherase [Enterococcus faecalis]